MRRLAKNSRNDSYLSNRDYQEIVRENTTTISFPLKEKHTLTLTKKIGLNQTAGFGGWFFPDSPCLLTVTVLSSFGTKVTSKTFSLSKDWNRVGLAWINEHSSDTMSIVLEFSDVEIVHTWGLTCDVFNVHELIIDAIEDQNKLIDVLNQEHLSPETYYLNHDSDTDLIENLASTEEIKIVNQSQKQISLKKCCYCQRYMPVNILVRSNSSFHKHKSKKTGFQNECRACKKWRINNSFNPVRTKDQLHASAVITRKKKILLKEPEILQISKWSCMV